MNKMKSRLSTQGLARMSAHHPWRMLGAWLLIVVLAIALQGTMSGALTNDANFTNNPESKQGLDLIESRIGKEPLAETVVITSTTKTVNDADFKAVVEQTTKDLTGMTKVVAGATNYYQAQQAGDPSAQKLVSKDGHSTIIPVTLTSSNYDDLHDYGKQYVATAQAQAGNGIDVYAVGDLSGAEVYNHIADEDMGKDLTIGLPVAAIVLIFVFGALVAAGLPLLLGIVAIVVATGLTAVLSQIIDVNSTVTVMISMIGLAVGIDYALFLIERFREERRHGLAKHDAIEVAGGTAGKAVFFSGGTVIFALLGMFIIPVTIFHSLAVGAVLAVLVAVFATQTLIPALLSLIGDKINWPRRPKYDAVTVSLQRRYDQETIHRGFWGRVTRVVMNKPAVAISVALLVLVVAAVPYFTIQTGMPSYETLPDSTVKTGYEVLARDFYAGEIAPVEFVIKGAPDNPTVAQGVEALKAKLADDSLYGVPSVTGTKENGGLTIVKAPMGLDPNSEQAFDQIHHLRNDIVPAAFGNQANNVYVTGMTAGTVDFNSALSTYTPYVFAFVLGLSFLLLMMAFRSVVVPLTAIVMNLLSVGAAYGIVVGVFQHGWGANLLGMQQTETITAWLPIFLFCILFGLSMDYHVFLLSRIREHFDQTHRNDESVAVGLQATGKIITGAALIMVAVFATFASGRLVDIQQMGFGLAVAIFLDATVVRSILVPSVMKVLGSRNWYLPSLLRWLPDLRIDGETVSSLGHSQAPQGAQAGD